MNIRRTITALLLASGATLMSAHADIGGIGSPVKASNPPPAVKAPVNAAQPQPSAPNSERQPVLIIRFNQQHVYFERPLRQAVDSTEKAKAGALYDVVSMVPSGSGNAQNQRLSADATANMNAVVQELQNLGIQPERIHTSTQSSAAVSAQEIDIFVN